MFLRVRGFGERQLGGGNPVCNRSSLIFQPRPDCTDVPQQAQNAKYEDRTVYLYQMSGPLHP